MAAEVVGLLGASSSLGRAITTQLLGQGTIVHAWSRKPHASMPGLHWHEFGPQSRIIAEQDIELWISAAPIWVLPPYLEGISASGATRLLAISSTSRFTKLAASDPDDNAIAEKLIHGEAALAAWCHSNSVSFTILQPTLIYGTKDNRNLNEIARVIRKVGFFPVFGHATGLRRPIHVDDLARSAIAAVQAETAANKIYVISGGETLTYRDMVCRVFLSMHRRPVTPSIPLWAFALALKLAGPLGLADKLSIGMAERMNADMDFASDAAERDFGHKARQFEPPELTSC